MSHKAIYNLYSNVVTIDEPSDGVFVAKDADGNEVTLDMAAVTAWSDPDEYKYSRAEAYPSIADQLDMIFHAGLGGDEFQAAIQAVKDAYPKPE